LDAADPPPGPVPAELRTRLKLDAFYQKHVGVGGLPVLGSAKVSDNALCEAAWIVRRMLSSRDDILKAMASQNVRAVVMAKDEFTTDVPEHARLRPKLFWDRRARGLGATPRAPVVSGAEENLLNFRRDPYPDENIFLHEFAHAIHSTGLNKVDPGFDERLKTAFSAAKDRGLWKNTYAGTNRHEYWAEGVQSWFDDNAPPDALHNDVRTRERLKEYDPGLAALCKEVFGDGPWRYVKPRDRSAKDRAHLVDYDPNNVPRFRWRETPASARPRVVIQTSEGDFDVELETASARVAVTNFLRIALDGGYHSGRFHRISGGGVWAAPSEGWKAKHAKELTLEDVPLSTAAPLDGTIALVQEESGWTGFAVFLGDKIDVGSAKVVPIGKIAKGRDVVEKIGQTPARDGRMVKAVEIRRVIRNE
jgi:cyclophilin family peptidyl-prolyl cis-trans isomerase